MKLQKTLLATSLFFAFAANAHNIWLEPIQGDADHYVLKFGHEETETYPESKLKAVKLADSQGKITQGTYVYKNGEAIIYAPKTSIVFTKFDNGIWSKLPSGRYVEKTKQQEPTAVTSVNPIKFGKTILHWDTQAYKTQHMEYELIPLTQAKAGQPLNILVLHDGKPVEGIKIGEGEEKPFNLTNKEGIAQFTPQKGNNRVWAEFEAKVPAKANYDRRKIEYLMTFDAE